MRGNSHVRFGEKSRGNDPHKRHRAARLTPRPACTSNWPVCPGGWCPTPTATPTAVTAAERSAL